MELEASNRSVEWVGEAVSEGGGTVTAMTLLVKRTNRSDSLFSVRLMRATKPHRHRNTANR